MVVVFLQNVKVPAATKMNSSDTLMFQLTCPHNYDKLLLMWNLFTYTIVVVDTQNKKYDIFQ